MKIKNDSELLKKNLEDLKPFKVYLDDKEDGIWKYDDEDGHYHQAETGWFRLSISEMLRAIVDETYFIKLEIPEANND